MKILMEGRERRFVRYRIVFAEIAQLGWNRHGPATAAGVVVFDRDFDIGQMLSYRCLEVGQADRLQAHIGIVKVLYRRLNQYYFQIVKVISDRLRRGKIPLCPSYLNLVARFTWEYSADALEIESIGGRYPWN